MPSTRTAWPRWWASALAWGLWALALLGLAATAWLDQLLRQAGLPHLSTGTGNAVAAGAAVVAATVGALVASRGPAILSAGCCWPSDSR